MSSSSRPSDAALSRELDGLRKLYGAKFNAICSALGHTSEAIRLLDEEGDPDAALDHLRETERILIDA